MGNASQTTLTVSKPEVAEVLADSSQWRMLATFVIQERSLTEAAKLLGLKLPALSYRVKKWLELGLLNVTHEEKRQGRAIKYYRAAGERFFIPFALTRSETLEALLLTMVQPAHELAMRETAFVLQQHKEHWGLLLSSSAEDSSSKLSVSLVDRADAARGVNETMLGPDEPVLNESFSTLQLDFETAKQLQNDLENLYQMYQDRQQEGRQKYLLRLGITPLRVGVKVI